MAFLRNDEFRNLTLIFLTAVIVRVLLFLAVGPWDDRVEKDIILTFQDAASFHQTSIFIAEDKQIIGVYDKELYVYFIAFLYSIFGYKPFIVIIFQIVMAALTCVFLYKIGQKIFNEKIAFFAGMLLAFEYSSILYSNHLMSEVMFSFLFTVHIYFLATYLTDKKWSSLIYAAVFLGLSSHVRSIGLYFIVFLTWPLFLYFRTNIRKCVVSLFILTSLFFLTVAPWMVRNYVVAGEFTLSTDQGKTLLWLIPNIMNIVKPRGTARRWTAEEKRLMVEEAEQPGMNIAAVVRKYRKDGVTATKLARWQKRFHEGTLRDDRPFLANIVDPEKPENQRQVVGWFGTRIQAEEIPMNKKIMNAVLADTKSFIKGIFIYFTVLDSSLYPQILGQPVHSLSEGIWKEGLWEVIKVTIREKSGIEWFIISFSGVFLFYLYATMCFGVYSATRKKEFVKIVLFTCIIVYFVIASASTTFHATSLGRYRLPIMPFVILLSCYGVAELAHSFRKTAT